MLGRFGICCTLLAVALQVCLASVMVKVTPEVEVIKGETVQLPCSYTTSAPASAIVVQWLIEVAGARKQIAYKSPQGSGVDAGTTMTDRLTMGDDLSLTISKVMVEDERIYICQVTAGAVGFSENATQVKVFFAPEKPIITGNNQAITVSHDTIASSEVGKCISRNAYPEPRIIWFKDATPLPEEKNQKEPTYVIPSLVKEASGLYTMTSTLFMQLVKADAKSVFHCTVVYDMPNKQNEQESSDKFSLSLLYPTENVYFKLKNQGPVKEGDDVLMECETDGNPQPEFDFYKNDTQLHGLKGMLKVKSVTRKDAGIYKCEALDFDSEDDVELIKTLNLNVHYLEPVRVTPEGPLLAAKGDTVELQCRTKSSDEYTLQWKKDSKELSQTGVLTLQSVTLADAGVYFCVGAVPSVPGLQKQANVTLTVTGAPEIAAPVNGFVDKEGVMVTLNCSALGHPAPQFTWKPSGKESVTVMGNKVISTVTLEASAMVLKDGVICEAYNKHGRESKNFRVSIKSDPDKSSDPNAANRGRHLSQLSLLLLFLSGLFLVHTP